LEISYQIYNEFWEWTPLKLILLNYALNVCTTIIKKTSFFTKKYYIDIFAGSGLNKTKSKNDFLIGSPLISSLNHCEAYDEMIFSEKEPLLSEALDLRLKTLDKSNLKVKRKEYETCLPEILKKVEGRKTYSFFFIDPHCMEFTWEFMKEVLNVRSDIIFTFMTGEIWRAAGLANAGLSKGKVLTNLFGDESWKKAKNAEDLIEIYKKNILKERSEAPIRTIKIQSKQFNFYYHLFFITNKTKGENRWLRAIDKAKEEIESNSDLAVIMALDIIKGRQSQIADFDKSNI